MNHIHSLVRSFSILIFGFVCISNPCVQRVHAAKPVKATADYKIAETEEAITISRGDSVVLTYNKVSPPVPEGIDPVYARSGFLHPVRTPLGHDVTAAFPVDHAHQQGIFTAWVNTRYADQKVDFWNLAKKSGEVAHQQVTKIINSDEQLGFEVKLVHRIVGESPVDVLREDWKVSVHPTDGSYHCFDLELTQTALTETPLVINKYHYGGMAVRGPVSWIVDKPSESNTDEALSGFLNNLGSDRLKGNHEHARWVSLYGPSEEGSVSVTVLSAKSNFRSPQAARLHPTKPYFCLAPCVDDEFKIDQSHPYTARYRYLVTDAKPDPEWIEEQWESWQD